MSKVSGDDRRGSLVQFSIGEFCLVVAAVAAICTVTATAFVALPFLAILLTRRASGMKPAWQVLIVTATYLPSLIGLKLVCEHCKWFWVQFAGVVPGGIVWEGIRTMFRSLSPDDPIAFFVSAVSTLAILVGGMLIARRGPRWALGAATLILIASSIAYGIVYAIVRM